MMQHIRGRSTVQNIAIFMVCCCTCAMLLWPTFARQSQAATTSVLPWNHQDAAHLLRRAGFSGTPQQIDRLQALGMDGAVDYLLTGNLSAGQDTDAAPFASAKLQPMHLDLPPGDDLKKGKQRALEVAELRMQWVDRMVHTDRPLEEKMTLFWHGLFTSGIREVKSADQLLVQNQLFHRYALGNYRDLALAIIHDPAMLKYLNNNENVKGKPNENLARELCELFTMGEGKGYTETDIGQIARALTGAGARGKDKNPEGQYVFNERKHDDGSKTIFGHTGNYMPDDVIALIFARPEPANYLARRLWIFFAYPDPSEKEIAPIAEIIRNHHYEVAPAVRAILTSPAFYSERSKFSTIKSPAELVVGTIRMLEVPVDTPRNKNVLRPQPLGRWANNCFSRPTSAAGRAVKIGSPPPHSLNATTRPRRWCRATCGPSANTNPMPTTQTKNLRMMDQPTWPPEPTRCCRENSSPRCLQKPMRHRL